jgi:hypothetical protein
MIATKKKKTTKKARRTVKVANRWVTLLARLIDVLGHTDGWKGACSKVADALQDEMEPGEVAMIRGHWIGPVADGSLFARKPVSGHTWLQMKDGTIVDPTRWVFENVEPYIFVGSDDENYDEGGQRLREAVRVMRGSAPRWDKAHVQYTFEGPTKVWVWIESQFEDTSPDKAWTLSRWQVAWIANTSPREFWPFAPIIYHWLEKVGMKTYVPIDLWRMVEREHPEF